MAKKILTYCLILFALYNLFLVIVVPSKLTPQSNYDFNVVKAQEYLRNATKYKAIIVGSSLGNRIDQEIFNDDYGFLTFSGYGSGDGLEIVKQSGQHPEVIFIETNILERVMNKSFTEDVLNLAFVNLNSTVPSVNRKNKPSSVAHKSLAYFVYGFRNQFRQDHDKRKKPLEVQESPQKVLKKANSKSDNQKVPNLNTAANAHFRVIEAKMKIEIPDDLLEEALEQLKDYVNYFESNGTKVVFYEMPIEKDLINLAKPSQVRDIFLSNFPKTKYNYIIADSDFKVKSNDGIHLIGSSITEYSIFFRSESSKHY